MRNLVACLLPAALDCAAQKRLVHAEMDVDLPRFQKMFVALLTRASTHWSGPRVDVPYWFR
ncbi:MAG TPA: hypothetical protein VFU55_13130 [Terracidiphilus sp.]|nr:hypothetical protein [Terracidiphilus sp.]